MKGVALQFVTESVSVTNAWLTYQGRTPERGCLLSEQTRHLRSSVEWRCHQLFNNEKPLLLITDRQCWVQSYSTREQFSSCKADVKLTQPQAYLAMISSAEQEKKAGTLAESR